MGGKPADDDVLAHVPAAVIAVDLQSRVTTWSRGAELLYGWSADEAVGRSVRELFLVDQLPRADEVKATTHAGEAWEGEMVVRHRDGSSLLVHVRNSPVRDDSGAVVGVIGASMDVAEARRLESRRAEDLVRASADADAAVERLRRLQRLTAALVPAQDQAQVVTTICEEVVGAVGAAAAGIVLADETRERLQLVGSCGYPAELTAPVAELPLRPGMPVTDCYLQAEPLLFHDGAAFAAAYPAVAGSDSEYSARACLPVVVDGSPIGVLALSFAGRHDFVDEERELLATIARMCGQALERVRLFAAERRARERDAFVSEATSLLASSLDVDATLQHLSALLVPQLADYVVVHLLDATSGRPRLAAATHRRPELTEWVRAHARANPVDLASDGGLGEVLRTGTAIYYPSVPPEMRERITDQAGADLADDLVPRTGLGVPLVAAGRVLGALGVLRTREAPFAPEELALLREVADRAAVAVTHARAYDRERTSALTLQRSLLPQHLPPVPGLTYDWRYLPGAEGVHVGGDWYDVVPLEHGWVAVLIGDVMGRGLQAAAVMGQLRATARAHAVREGSPSAVLRELDLAVGRLEQGSITTALVGVLDPATGSFTYASAGHLPPLHAPVGGPAEFLPVDPGPPLGAGADAWPESTTRLRPGDTLLLYTDGLVEDRLRSVGEGMEVLRSSLGSPDGPSDACDRALAGTGRDAGHDDDTALLAVTLAGPDAAAEHFVSVEVTGPQAARQARDVLRGRLASWGVAPEAAEDVLVVATELTVNAVLHVGGAVRVTLRRTGARLRLEVQDSDAAASPLPSLSSLTKVAGRADDDQLDAVITALGQEGMTGRGMTLVAALAEEWGWSPEPGGGKVVWASFSGVAESFPPPAAPAVVDPGAGSEVVAVLRGLPVRLVLASAAHLDDLERELSTGQHGPEAQDLLERGAELLEVSARVREPVRLAAREALSRGQRLVDATAPVSEASLGALVRMGTMLGRLVELSGRGELLTPLPDEELSAFRVWWAEELHRQLQGGAPRTCPFPALPGDRPTGDRPHR